MSSNQRGIALMVAGMAAFAVEDMFIKLASPGLPTGQILAVLGMGGLVFFAAMAARQGRSVLDRRALHPMVLGRNAGEMLGTFGFVSAIALAPLTVATSIFQATPLVVTMGAALLLGEKVGWRRWTAIALGFAGVLVIIRPWGEAFEPASLLALLGVVGLSARDLLTRRVPADVDSVLLSGWAMAAVVLCGLLMLAATGGVRWPDAGEWALLAGASAVGVVAYWLLTEAMRAGEVSVVTPFRYSRLLFAIAIGVLVFDERPDALVFAGAALVIGSGLYTFARERARARAEARALALETAAG